MTKQFNHCYQWCQSHFNNDKKRHARIQLISLHWLVS